MSRPVTTAVGSYLTEPVLDFRILADVTFSSTTMKLHTGIGALAVGVNTYDGIGALGTIDSVREDANTFTSQVKMTLSAVNSLALQEALNETLFGRQVILRRCWLREGTVVGTAETWFRGQIGEVKLHRGDPERGNYIAVNVETKLNRQSKMAYYTKEDLASVYSGDTFFDYLHLIGTTKALWGDQPTRFSSYTTTVRRGRFPLPG